MLPNAGYGSGSGGTVPSGDAGGNAAAGLRRPAGNIPGFAAGAGVASALGAEPVFGGANCPDGALFDAPGGKLTAGGGVGAVGGMGGAPVTPAAGVGSGSGGSSSMTFASLPSGPIAAARGCTDSNTCSPSMTAPVR